MEGHMKKKILIVNFLLIFIFLFSCPFFSYGNITIGYDTEETLIEKNSSGKVVGFLVEIIDAIGKAKNTEIIYEHMNSQDLDVALSTGSIDYALKKVNKEEARENVRHQTPLLKKYYKVYLAETVTVSTLEGIENLDLGYIEEDISGFSQNLNLEKYKSLDALREAVEAGNLQGILFDENKEEFYNLKKDFYPTAYIVGPLNYYLFAKNQELSSFLRTVDYYLHLWSKDTDSIYFETYDDYFVKSSFFNVFLDKIVIGILFLLFIVIYFRFKIIFQRKTISDKEKTLTRKIKENVELNRKFENLLAFLSLNMKEMHTRDDDHFFSSLLQEALDLVHEADYGVVFSYNLKNQLHIIDTIGIEVPFERGFYYKKSFDYVEDLVNSEVFIKDLVENHDIPKGKESLLLNFSQGEGTYTGVLIETNEKSDKTFSKTSIHILDILKSLSDAYFLNEDLHKIQENFQKEIIFSIVQMLEIHDEYTKGHSESVANLASQLAKVCGLSDKKVNEIYWAGLVHDIGKILVDRKIINKKGKLTFSEQETIKKHPIFGYKALSQSKVTASLAEYVLHHHERVDGAGYPNGLKNEEIPIEAKIICIVDSYDAMVSKRSYKGSLTKEEAIIEIEHNLGKQFDEDIGRKFIELIQIIEN
jgi:putative nucleotidyltransferase with HDIG domain